MELSGNNVVNMTVRREVLEDAWAAGGLGLLLVTTLLWIDFRGLRRAAMALAPLLVGLAWMLGAMVLFEIHMNFINIFVTTMIIGIGVDYGVHVLHRYLEVRDLSDEDFGNGLHETGKAVVAAALSTIAGFGSITWPVADGAALLRMLLGGEETAEHLASVFLQVVTSHCAIDTDSGESIDSPFTRGS